jgi:hypothetical protein
MLPHPLTTFASCCALPFILCIDNDIGDDLQPEFEELAERNMMRENPNTRWCPKNGCGKGVVGSDDQPHLVCPRCAHEFCWACGEDWHESRTCDENREVLRRTGKIDTKTEKWKRKAKTKQCPQCKSDIEKDVGCNHMKCSTCKYEVRFLSSSFSLASPVDDSRC